MRALIQCVSEASVTVEGRITGSIGRGMLVFLGVGHGDTTEQADKLWSKISKMRIFEDADGKTNLSLADIGGEVLVVSQFTLYANCRKGNRPRQRATLMTRAASTSTSPNPCAATRAGSKQANSAP